MSYILEALKKSERERELGAVPSLARIREDGPAPGRRWLPAALALALVLCVVLIGWNFRDGLARLWTPTPAAPQSAALQPAAPRAAAPAPKVAPPEPVTLAPAPGPQATPEATPSAPATSAPLAGPAASPAAPIEWSRLDEGIKAQLPGLAVNVLSYSQTPAKRFVMINQQIMREGQSLRGVELVSITRDGAVMRYRGTEFMLRP